MASAVASIYAAAWPGLHSLQLEESKSVLTLMALAPRSPLVSVACCGWRMFSYPQFQVALLAGMAAIALQCCCILCQLWTELCFRADVTYCRPSAVWM